MGKYDDIILLDKLGSHLKTGFYISSRGREDLRQKRIVFLKEPQIIIRSLEGSCVEAQIYDGVTIVTEHRTGFIYLRYPQETRQLEPITNPSSEAWKIQELSIKLKNEADWMRERIKEAEREEKLVSKA